MVVREDRDGDLAGLTIGRQSPCDRGSIAELHHLTPPTATVGHRAAAAAGAPATHPMDADRAQLCGGLVEGAMVREGSGPRPVRGPQRVGVERRSEGRDGNTVGGAIGGRRPHRPGQGPAASAHLQHPTADRSVKAAGAACPQVVAVHRRCRR